MEKLISVIVPCYNVSNYIEKCVDSILNSTYKHLEVILINDGSTDDTGLKIDQFQRIDSRVIVIHQENKGLSESRNIGIAKACGEFIAFIDSDDWISVNYFDILISSIKINYDLVVTSYNRVYKNNIVARDFYFEGELNSITLKRRMIGLIDQELKDPSQADSLVTVWGKLYKSSIIKNNHLSFVDVNEVGTAEDLLFNLNYLKFSNSISFIINQPLYFYRKSNLTSYTKTYKDDLFFKWQNLYKLINYNVNDSQEKIAFQNRICLSIIGLGLNEMSNPKGYVAIEQNLKKILSTEHFQTAYKNLNFQYFPIHWKIFFWAAKSRNMFILILMLKFMEYTLKRNNK